MGTNNQYNFKEAELGPNFAPQHMKDFKELIDSSISFVAMSMPGVGASYFLKYLSTQAFALFFHVDLYSLPVLTQHEFYKLLLIELGGKPTSKTDEQLLLESKKILKEFAQKKDKIVIIFSHFDQLKKELDWNFLSNIQSFTTVAPGKIVLIFTSIKPLYELAPDAVSGGNLNFYSENLYFKPFSKEDLKKLLSIEPARSVTKETLDHLLDLSGGHNQLLHILLRSQKQQNFLLDQFVKLQMKELIDYLNYQQKKEIQKMASVASHPERAKRVEGSIDDYLLGVGMVKRVGKNFELFTPLLVEYLKLYFSPKLPPKEAKLLNLLRKNIGKVVTKDEIFEALWEDSEKATDWALDALIYRLRKHPFMKAHGYVIESQKKVGYILIQT